MNKKKSTSLKVRHLSLFWGLSLLLTTACIDERYDLEVSQKVNFGGENLTFFLGSTDSLKLSSVLDSLDTDLLQVIDGKYAITEEGEMNETINAIGTVTINAIKESKTFDVDFKQAELPHVGVNITESFGVESQFSDKENIQTTLNENLHIGIQSFLPTTIPMEYEIATPLTVETETISPIRTVLAAGAACPEEITVVKAFLFGDQATLTLDYKKIRALFSETNFHLTIPSLELTFPEGFVISATDSRVTVDTTQPHKVTIHDVEAPLAGNSIQVAFTIENYSNELRVNEAGVFGGIETEIGIALKNFSLWGSVKAGDVPASLGVDLNIYGNLSVDDMEIAAEGIQVDLPEKVFQNEIVVENIPQEIKAVKTIDFEQNSQFVLSISPIDLKELHLSTLSPTTSLRVLIPADKFQLAENAEVTLNGANYEVELPIEELISGNIYQRTLQLERLNVNQEVENGTLRVASAFRLQAATLYFASSSILLSDARALNQTQTIDIQLSTPQDLEVANAEITTNTITASTLDEEGNKERVSFSTTTTVPKELVALNTITLAQPVTATLYVEVEGLPQTAGALSLVDYEIEFPKFLNIDAASGVVDHKLTLNDTFAEEGEKRVYEKSIVINGFDFTGYSDLINPIPNSEEKELKLADEILFGGDFSMASGDVSSNTTIHVSSTFIVPAMEIAEITGRVDAFIESENKSNTVSEASIDANVTVTNLTIELNMPIDLSEMTSEASFDANITLTNPTLELNVGNTMGVPLAVEAIQLTPYKDGQPLAPIVANPFTIRAAEVLGEATTTHLLFSKEGVTPGGDVEGIAIPRIGSLLEELPDSVILSLKAGTGDGEHRVDLTRSYELNLDYAVHVPLQFDAFSLAYNDTIEELHGAFDELFADGLVQEIVLLLEVENGMPFNISIDQLIALGEEDEPLNIPSFVVAGKNTLQAFQTTTLELRIDGRNSSELEKLDAMAIALSASVNETVGGVALEPNQYVKTKLKVRVPGGLTYDLDAE